MSAVAAGPGRFPLLVDQTVDETTSIPVLCAGMNAITFYVEGKGTTSSGVVTIEEADWVDMAAPTYGGTWSAVTTVNASDVTGGAQKAVHLATGAYAFVRVRISTVIGGGGSISAVLRAQ